MQKINFIADKNNLRLDHYLVEKFPQYSRAKIKNCIDSGKVTINEKKVKPSFILKGKEKIKCNIQPSVDGFDNIIPENIKINIVYEDSDLLIINKPRGLVVHPGNGNRIGTLLNGLIYHYKSLSHPNSLRPGIVHRLDKDTSGIMLVAKNDITHDNLSKQFSKRTIKKYYNAIVWGRIPKQGIINNNIGRNPKDRKIFKVVNTGGKNSITCFKMNEYNPPFSFIEVIPKTGRTHQIRVHLKSLGHPILGDNKYGGGIKMARSFHVKYINLVKQILNKFNGFALHAHALEIIHPSNKQKMIFKAPIPEDIKNILKILRNEKIK